MNRISLCLLILALPAGLARGEIRLEAPAASPPALPSPADARPASDHLPMPLVPRGQMLYENHCMGCHESVLFIRERRDVKTLPALRKEVERWALASKLPWRDEEIVEVTRYLNRSYYRFPEP